MSPTTSTSSTVPAKVAGATELPSDAPAQDVAQHDNEENAKQGHPHNASGDKSGLNGGGDTSSHADHNLSKKKPEQVVEDEATGNSSNEGSLSAKRSGTAIQTRTGSEEEDTDGEQDAEADGSSAGHETAAETADTLRRKRDREGSIEPSLSQREANPIDTLPAKKNRVHGELASNEKKTGAANTTEKRNSSEGERVGHIRKRVQDLSWKQRKEGERDDGQDDESTDIGGDKLIASKDANAGGANEKTESKEAEIPPASKKQPTFASFSSKGSGFGSAAKPSSSIFDSPTTTQDDPTSSGSPPTSTTPAGVPSPARTQPTFSSFSKTASPFNAATSSVAGPSWLAGKSSSGGGVKPSALGSVGSTSGRDSSSPPPVVRQEKASTDAPSTATASGKPLGFGAFASSKMFVPGSVSGSRGSTPASVASEKGASTGLAPDEAQGNAKSFDEALRKENNLSQESTQDKPKATPLLERGQADLRTGEEDEQVIASVRAKLFTMADDKSWKERGTGTVRCNTGKDGKGSGARLVMRSEGVLRLILNVNLFAGMGFNLEQDKFLRIVALEAGKTVTFALKIGNATNASQFYRTVKRAIPVAEEFDAGHLA